MLMLASLITAALGALALAFGLIGRRVDRVPRCRFCGFDMSGAAVGDTCPECGPERFHRRGIRHGQRRTRWAVSGLGVIMLLPLLPLATLWLTGGPVANRLSTRLLLDLRVPALRQDRDEALRELTARWSNGELAKWQQRLLADWSTRAWAMRLPDEALRSVALFEQVAWTGHLEPSLNAAIIAAAAADLRSDDRSRNADRARSVLALMGQDAEPTLRDLVDTGDPQQRRIAAHLLLDAGAFAADPAVLRVLVDNLKNDDIESNAADARWALRSIVDGPDEAAKRALGPLLEDAVATGDTQGAARAASLLYALDPEHPAEVLLRRALSLCRLTPPNRADAQWRRPWSVQETSAILAQHKHRILDALTQALASDDARERFVAAWALTTGDTQGLNPATAQRIAEVMIPHLAENTIGGDGSAACASIYRAGPATLPALHAALANGPDEQQRDLLTRLIRDITQPPTSPLEWELKWGGNPASPRLQWTPLDRYAAESIDLDWPIGANP